MARYEIRYTVADPATSPTPRRGARKRRANDVPLHRSHKGRIGRLRSLYTVGERRYDAATVDDPPSQASVDGAFHTDLDEEGSPAAVQDAIGRSVAVLVRRRCWHTWTAADAVASIPADVRYATLY